MSKHVASDFLLGDWCGGHGQTSPGEIPRAQTCESLERFSCESASDLFISLLTKH